MSTIINSFKSFIKQIVNDNLLYGVIFAPFLTAFFFRFAIPYLESLLCAHFNMTSVLSNYYLLFDLFLALITSYMFCFVSAMVMLTEHDENMSSYLAVTPIGLSGYIISRLCIPAIISFIVSVFLLVIFSLTHWNIGIAIIACFFSALLSVIVALIIYSLSKNRVEGMAMYKLSGIFMLGLLIPFFVLSSVQYFFFFLPSFWIAKIVIDNNIIYTLPLILTTFLWFSLMYKKFIKKLC